MSFYRCGGGGKHSFELAFSDYSQYNSTRDVGVNFSYQHCNTERQIQCVVWFARRRLFKNDQHRNYC